MSSTSRPQTVAVLLGFAFLGCEQQPKSDTPKVDAAASQPGVDPEIARAVSAVGSAKAKGGSSPGADQGGPPETGVFEPGAADRELAVGAAPKLTLGSDGTEPRVKLGGQPQPGKKIAASLSVTRTQRQQQQPAFVFALSVEPQKPKAVSGGASAGAAGSAPPAATGIELVDVITQITGVTIDDPRVPKDEAAALAKLKGSKISFQIRPDGGSNGMQLELSKTADAQFGEIAGNVVEALAQITLPFPDKPLGKGAYWMATTRETVIGVDAVSYRMIKVESLSGDSVTLSVKGKRYAASSHFALPGAPKELGELSLQGFQSTTEGTVTFKVGAGFPDSAQLAQVMVAILAASGGDPKKPLQLQLQIDSTLSRK